MSSPKSNCPTIEVYGNTDHAALRLITCGGKFDFNPAGHERNIVAYALAGLQPSRLAQAPALSPTDSAKWTRSPS